MSSNIDVTIHYVLSSGLCRSNRCFRRWRHLAIISVLLLRRFYHDSFAISNFSFRHSKQRFDSGVYAFAFLRILQLTEGVPLASFTFHSSTERDVLFLYRSWLNDDLWFANRFLKVLSHNPMYFFSV